MTHTSFSGKWPVSSKYPSDKYARAVVLVELERIGSASGLVYPDIVYLFGTLEAASHYITPIDVLIKPANMRNWPLTLAVLRQGSYVENSTVTVAKSTQDALLLVKSTLLNHLPVKDARLVRF
jgi:hypothetical protein